MTADVQRELAEALRKIDKRPESDWTWLAADLLPTVQRLIADAEKRAAAAARREQQLWDRRRVEDYAAVVGVKLSPGDDMGDAVNELYLAAIAALDPT